MPGRTPANKAEQAVQFRMGDAQRIADAVHAYETSIRDAKKSYLPRAFGGGGGSSLRLGKTTALWARGTVTTIEVYEKGGPLGETKDPDNCILPNCVNKMADVPAGKWVIVAELVGRKTWWYLVAAECEVPEDEEDPAP